MSKELLQQAVNGATGETYLCRAWGETDLTLAAIVVGLDRVQAFLVEYWLGSDDHTDDDGTETLPSVMADIQKCLAGSDDRWSLEFEIGGISVETVDAVAVSRLAQPASVSDTEILALNHGEKFFSESQTRYPEAGHGTQYHAGAPGVIGFARAVITKIAQPAQEPVTDQSAKESAQRAAQAVRFAGRNGPATADFDLPATNDRIEQPSKGLFVDMIAAHGSEFAAEIADVIAQPVQPSFDNAITALIHELDETAERYTQNSNNSIDGLLSAAANALRELQTRSTTAQLAEPVAFARADTVFGWKGQLLNIAWMFPSPVGLKNPIALYAAPVAQAEPLSDTQIEAGASALVGSCISKGHWAHATDESKAVYRQHARAVLETIKPPIGAQE